jgi:hypothetical protein
VHALSISYQGAQARQRWWAAGVLALYGLFLFFTDPLVTVFDDEAGFVLVARKGVGQLLAAFVSGNPDHQHPPLPDILLHFWLRLAGTHLVLVRVPSIVCYCLALWIIAETADLLWRRRWVALIIGVAWPIGYCLGRAAGWYTVSVLELAALTWLYFRWRETEAHFWWLAACSLMLVYTNYFGWVFLGVLFADLVVVRASRRSIGLFAAMLGVLAVASAPLFLAFSTLIDSTVTAVPHQPLLEKAVHGAYLIYSLLAGEMTAPWSWPGVIAAAAGLGLLWFYGREPESRRLLLWFAASFLVGASLGALTGKRTIMFAPWFLLLLVSAVRPASAAKTAVLVGLTFALGWLGIATGIYPATYRYIEPWRDVTSQVLEMSKPGDVIVSSHNSFYFYLSYLSGWEATKYPLDLFTTAGRTFSRLDTWERSAPGAEKLIYVRSNLMPWNPETEKDLFDYAARHFRLIRDWHVVEDRSAGIKHYFFPEVRQPEWRIEVLVWNKP